MKCIGTQDMVLVLNQKVQRLKKLMIWKIPLHRDMTALIVITCDGSLPDAKTRSVMKTPSVQLSWPCTCITSQTIDDKDNHQVWLLDELRCGCHAVACDNNFVYNIYNKSIDLKSDASFTENTIHSLASIDYETISMLSSSDNESSEYEESS